MDAIKDQISASVAETSDLLRGSEYLESQYRRVLARQLQQHGLQVYQEVPMVFKTGNNPIPFGHGFCDIVVYTPEGVIILELKITNKDARFQLNRYMQHWNYCHVLLGCTVNFFKGDSIIRYAESPDEEIQDEESNSFSDVDVRERVCCGC